MKTAVAKRLYRDEVAGGGMAGPGGFVVGWPTSTIPPLRIQGAAYCQSAPIEHVGVSQRRCWPSSWF